MAGWVRGGEPILAMCTFIAEEGTPVKFQAWESDEDEYRVNVMFGGESMQGEVTMDIPESVLGVLITQLKAAAAEIETARTTGSRESGECVRADA